MAETLEEALASAEDPDSLSFYGLSLVLEGLLQFLGRKLSDEAKEELADAQGRVRKAMGLLLESPALTKREQPLAESFLQEQLKKLGSTGGDAKATKKAERLRELLDGVRTAAQVADSPVVRSTEASIKKLAAEWKEVSPLYDKWQAGRHSFKTNSDLQAFDRRYKECLKGREAAATNLEAALRERRDEAASAAALAREHARVQAKVGWSSAAAKAAPPANPARRVAGVVRRPGPPPAQPGLWSSGLSMAQRMRAQVSASMREDDGAGEQEEVEEVGGEEEEEEVESDDSAPAARPAAPPPPPAKRPPPPPPPAAAVAKGPPKVVPKGPPPLPAELQASSLGAGFSAAKVPAAKPDARLAAAPSRWGRAAAVPVDEESDDEPVAAVPARAAKAPTASSSASAKKKGKAKKRKGATAAEDDDEDLDAEETTQARVPAASGGQSAAAWAAAVGFGISGSLLKELLSSSAWESPPDTESAELRLQELAEKLPWQSPLGLALPMDWAHFVGLEIDGGPAPTSKRGPAPWALRLQRTIPKLLPHYVSIVFFFFLLHALTHFGLPAWAFAAQVGLLLAPPEAVPIALRARLLQAAHLLVWVVFLRSLLLMHLFVKMFAVALVAGHAYVVADIPAE